MKPLMIHYISLLPGGVAGAARLPLHHGLRARRLLQPAEHPGAGPQGDARQPHQPDPLLHRGGRHPPHAGVHPLHRPHVHPRPVQQDQGGEGQYQLELETKIPQRELFVVHKKTPGHQVVVPHRPPVCSNNFRENI